jgi:VanZ family protein
MVSFMDEGHQTLYHTRSGSFGDVGLDMSAALVASLLTAKFWHPRARPSQVLAGSPPGRPREM